nr:hypothetical protein 25 [bacterium]
MNREILITLLILCILGLILSVTQKEQTPPPPPYRCGDIVKDTLHFKSVEDLQVIVKKPDL